MGEENKTYTQEEVNELIEAYERQKSELTDRTEAAEKASAKTRIQTDFISKAITAGIKYVDSAYKLADLSELQVTKTEIYGMDDAVKKLAAEKPYLLHEDQIKKARRTQRSIGGPTNNSK
jgi:hypothetical protein